MLFPNKRKYIGIGQNELKNIGYRQKSNIVHPYIEIFRDARAFNRSHDRASGQTNTNASESLSEREFCASNTYCIPNGISKAYLKQNTEITASGSKLLQAMHTSHSTYSVQ